MIIPSYEKIVARQTSRVGLIMLTCAGAVYARMILGEGRFASISVRVHAAYALLGILVPLIGIAVAVVLHAVYNWMRILGWMRPVLLAFFALTPLAAGGLGYVIERRHAWGNNSSMGTLEEALTALPLLWIGVLCGVLTLTILSALCPQCVGFESNAINAKKARRLAAVALSSCVACFVFYLLAPSPRELSWWWLKSGSVQLGLDLPEGDLAIERMYRRFCEFMMVIGPVVVIAGALLAISWRYLPLEHVAVKREDRRLIRERAEVCSNCSYPRAGLKRSSPCPECGKPF